MIKAILLDGDGVTLKQHRYFSDIYAEKNNLSKETIAPFFKGEFILCQKGQADLKEKLQPYLFKWGTNDSIDEFLNKWFTEETEPDEEVLEITQRIRNKNTKCYLATDQERYRAEYVNKVWNFNNKFDGTFYSCDLGHRKSEKEFFEKVIKRLNLNPEEIIYLDDDAENVNVAKELGIKAKVYKNINDLKLLNLT